MDERDERSDTPTNLHDTSSEHISSTQQKQKQHNGNDSIHESNGTNAQNSSGMNFKISSRG